MARSFNQKEKKIIKSSLMAKARDYFAQYGLKKTSIEELTKAANIGLGSFYIFYTSKEELYFEILEQEEKKLITTIEELLNSDKMTRKRFKKIMKDSFELMYENPFIRNLLQKGEYDLLMRKLPEERIRKHLQDESQSLNEAIRPFQERKIMKEIKPDVLAGLIYSLFLLYLHKEDIGTQVFPEIIELLIDIISDELIMIGKRNRDEGGAQYLLPR